ncbi:MAG: hypothetical protein ABIT70_11510 [Sulfuriferula sp.]
MKRNLGKYSTLMLLALTIAPLSGIASEDCRLDDGTSKEGVNGPAELLPPCSEQTEAPRDTPASRANETNQDPLAQKISTVPSQDTFRDKPR